MFEPVCGYLRSSTSGAGQPSLHRAGAHSCSVRDDVEIEMSARGTPITPAEYSLQTCSSPSRFGHQNRPRSIEKSCTSPNCHPAQ